MPATGENVRDYLKIAGWVLLSLIIVAIFIFVIPANIFFWKGWYITDHYSRNGLRVLSFALLLLAYETYKYIRRTENPWRSIVVIIVFVIPANVFLGVVWFIAERELYIGWVALGILSTFLGYKAYIIYKFLKRLQNPWQTFKANLKRSLSIFFSFAFTIYACMVLFDTLFPTEYGRCDFFNERLNGGVKKFQHQNLKVQFCGAEWHNNILSHGDYRIRLQVFSEQGELLATRYFTVNYGDGFERVIEYHPDSIKYYDFADHYDDDFESTLAMPPTTLDWMRARIPLLY